MCIGCLICLSASSLIRLYRIMLSCDRYLMTGCPCCIVNITSTCESTSTTLLLAHSPPVLLTHLWKPTCHPSGPPGTELIFQSSKTNFQFLQSTTSFEASLTLFFLLHRVPMCESEQHRFHCVRSAYSLVNKYLM